MFSGMPTTAISTRNKGDWTEPLYNLFLIGKRPATYLFIALLGAFLLMLALGVKPLLAVGGAIAVAFCSYNFQIIQVGHNTKMQAIAFMPWVLAALVYAYRSLEERLRRPFLVKAGLGAAAFGLALSFQIKANHQQITYYLAIMVLLYALVTFIDCMVRHRESIGRFFVVSLLLLVLGGFGIATNVNKLIPLYEYTAHTMRGGSELSGRGGSSEGLDLEYATAWSYGWEELPNLMIPNFNGGASAQAVNPDKSATIDLLRRAGQGNLRQTAKALPLYWGPQPFTAGPMYMGAITVFLFLLGLFVCKGKDRWWLAVVSLLAVLMALGNHFMGFTRLCFKVLPLYNKFRTVSMSLVALQLAFPMLGFLALQRVLDGGVPREKLVKGALAAFAVTGGFCLLCWLFPGIAGSFESPSDSGMQDVLVDALIADRKALLRSDALISLVFIGLSFVLVLWGTRKKAGKNAVPAAAAGIVLLVLVNMFSTGKRYLNSDHFTTPKAFNSQFAARPVDGIILEDTDPDFRVLDLTVNVFNSSVPSYHHKCVGGYSPAKLQRYQDLIDRYLMGEINAVYGSLKGAATLADVQENLPPTPILNALNTKYLIVDPNLPPVEDGRAMSPVWFVDSLVTAATPDEEIELIGNVPLGSCAVVGKDFAEALSGAGPASPDDRIELLSYAPNALKYRYSAANPRLAVFSEVFYPEGWTMEVGSPDGTAEKAAVSRADWLLRAAVLPAGEHEVTMRFAPKSYETGATLSRVFSILLLLIAAVLAAAAVPLLKRDAPQGR